MGLILWLVVFYGPILVQVGASVWLVQLMLRCHGLATGPWMTPLFCLGLGLTTGMAWSADQLMPDALVPLVVLALWLLGFHGQRLGRCERFGLTAVALLGLLSHMSGLALAIGLVLVIVLLWVAQYRRGWSLRVNLWPPLAVVVAALLLMPMLHLFLVGKAVFTPGGPVYIFGRLVQAGIAQRWLAEHCPVPGIKLCALQDRIPGTGDDFLWGETSPFRELGEWSGAADGELGYLVKMCFKTYPAAVAWTAVQATAEQMTMVRTGDQLGEIHNDTRNVFTNHLPPHVAAAFNGARQQLGGFGLPLFEAVNKVHVPVAHLSVFGLLLVIGWGLRSGRHDLAAVALYMLLALLGNAFICGALSNPHDRYQSRVVWLAPLVIAMAAVAWGQQRRINHRQ